MVALLAACIPLEYAGAVGKQTSVNPDLRVHVPFEEFTLPNGLRVIVSEDHKAPLVYVSVWYKVGSRDEPDGKAGFAHLYEHLSYGKTENNRIGFDDPMEKAGAVGTNGTTAPDRTMYFETVPTSAVDLALWLESERMGHLLGAVGQPELDKQRGVVENEKREGDNAPYGMVNYRLLEGLFPLGHPYRHDAIGSIKDLDAASLDDVKTWFRQYYGAANAVVSLAGDIDVPTARNLVLKYFGDINPGPPVARVRHWLPAVQSDVIDEMQDPLAPRIRLLRSWAVPGRPDKDVSLLEISANVLGGGKTSRLYNELVVKRHLADTVSASIQPMDLASIVKIEITLKPGVDQREVQRALNDVLATYLSQGPTADELARAKGVMLGARIRQVEQVGGLGKGYVLAMGDLAAGDPGYFEETSEQIRIATSQQVRGASQQWLGKPYYQLTVSPAPHYVPTPSTVDRSLGFPKVGDAPDIRFPPVQRATLSNGATVILAQRASAPVVNVSVQFDAGYAADAGRPSGIDAFTLDLMDEGTTKRDAFTLASDLERVGAQLASSSDVDTSTLTVSAPEPALDSALDILADIVENSAFAGANIERIRRERIAEIGREIAYPELLSLRTVAPVVYGEGHPYAVAYSGTGSAASVASITREDLTRFRRDFFRPDNATIFVVGDVKMAEVLPSLERALRQWRAPPTALPRKNIPQVALPAASRVILIDAPNTPQTILVAAKLLPPTRDANYLDLQIANDIIGGVFTSRLNMNLREAKGWAYGASSETTDARGQRMWMVRASVQTDKTAEAIAEILKETRNYVGSKPATNVEFGRAVRNRINALAGRYETSASVLFALQANQRYGRPQDYVAKLPESLRELRLTDVQSAAKAYFEPDQLTWIIVGDRRKIEAGIRALNIGPIEFRDQNNLTVK
jgi:zinc protease